MADENRERMRAADADRQRVADQLTAALEEGRLELHEYDGRLRDAYAAKTYGDLDLLLTDLPNARPVLPVAVPPPPDVVPARDGMTRIWLADIWGSWGRAAGFFTVLWAVAWVFSSDSLFYWPVWILGPWGVLLLLRTAAGVAKGEPREHAIVAEHRRQMRQHKLERKLLYRQAIADGQLPLNPSKEQRKTFIAQARARGELSPKPRRPTVDG